jgi:hypothetical protein
MGFAAIAAIALFSIETARGEYLEGTEHFRAKEWATALRLFEHSLSLVPSPNTELMIARCLVKLERRAEAVDVYARAVSEARRRVAEGESQYEQTAQVATNEETALRARLATVRVHVAPPAGATLLVDGAVVALPPDGNATLLHDPGHVMVVARSAAGVERRREVIVYAAGSHPVELVFEPEPAQGPIWPALASGGVMLGGLGVFIGFGASSQSTYDAIHDRCAVAKCGPADRAEAEDGARTQTIANVGLAVASVAAVATIVFVVNALSSDRMVKP